MYTRCNVLALHSLPSSAGYRLLHPSFVMYDLSGFSRPVDRFAGLLHPRLQFSTKTWLETRGFAVRINA